MREVATVLGTTPGRAASLIAGALATLPDRLPEVERAATLLRIDNAARAFGAALDAPDPGGRVAAAAGLIEAERLRADLLGLAPTAPRSQTA